jgi:uncharacterized protein
LERIGELETICRYPVKSMAGEELGEAFVGFAGVMGDRAYAFVRAPGPKGFPWHTGREQEDLIVYRPRYFEIASATLPVDVERSFSMAPGVNPIFPRGGGIRSRGHDAGRADAAGRFARGPSSRNARGMR